jgi:hypothetical protein
VFSPAAKIQRRPLKCDRHQFGDCGFLLQVRRFRLFNKERLIRWSLLHERAEKIPGRAQQIFDILPKTAENTGRIAQFFPAALAVKKNTFLAR